MPPDNRGTRVLVAGLGNIFFGDDAFGVEVARRLAMQRLPEHVRVVDAGIRTMHLAYEMVENRYDTVIFVDLVPRGGCPGTIYELEPDGADLVDVPESADAHDLRPDQIVAFARKLGARIGRVLIVGCEPACVDPTGALSEPVASAVDEATRAILRSVGASGEVSIGARI